MIRIEIPGRIVAKQSVRFTKAGHRYQPGDVVNYHALVATLAIEAMKGEPPLVGPVEVSILIVLAKPRSWSKKRQRQHEWCTAKPDLDNAAKAILDGLKGIAFVDDRNVCDLECHKVYGAHDVVVVEVEALPNVAADTAGRHTADRAA